MSDQNALHLAQLEQANQELVQLKNMTRSMSGQLHAQKQCIDEYLNANIMLRSSNLLLEDDVKNFQNQIAQTNERVVELEKEKSQLNAKLSEHALSTGCSVENDAA